MSSTSSINTEDTYLDFVGYSAQDWVQLSEEEQKAILKEKVQGMTEDKFYDTMDEVSEDANGARLELRDMERRYKQLKRQLRGKLSDAQELKLEQMILDLDAMQDQIKKDYPAMFKELATDEADINRDHSDGNDVNLNAKDLELDGRTYHLKMGGKTANPFMDDEGVLDGVTSDGTTSGNVIKDVNGDGEKNHKDIEAAVKEHNMARLGMQNMFIAADKVTLMSADTDSSTYVFKLEDSEGNYCLVELTEAEFVNFNFMSGILPEDIDGQVDESEASSSPFGAASPFSSNGGYGYIEMWPTELLERSYWQEDTYSFHDHMTKDNVSDEEKLGAIKGYDEAKSGLNKIAKYTDGKAPQPYANEAIDKLFDWASGDSDLTITETWQEIMDDISKLSPEKQALVLQNLVITVAVHAPDQFEKMMGPATSLIESKLKHNDNLSAADKLAVLLLETQGGSAGIYGGEYNIMDYVFAHEVGSEVVDGEWKEHNENVDALENFVKIVSEHMFGSLPGNVEEVIDRENSQ